MEKIEFIRKTFVRTIMEISSIKTFDMLKEGTQFFINDSTFDNLIVLKYYKYNFTKLIVEKNLECRVRKNIKLSKMKKAFSIDIITDEDVNIISFPVQKENGEMILFISVVTSNIPTDLFLLFMEMIVNVFYKNLIIDYVFENIKISATPNKKIFIELSDKEKVIADFLCNGLEDKEICQNCRISISTLRKYISKIFKDFDVKNRAEFVNKYNYTKIASIYSNII